MKTLTVTLYNFDELSPESQDRAIEDYRSKGYGDEYQWQGEAEDSIRVFCDRWNCKTSSRSYELSFGSCNEDNTILELSGNRLRTWILNNHYSDVYSPKYLGHKAGRARYSKCQVQDAIPTGYCLDCDLLDPIIDFIKKPDSRTIEDLLRESIESARIAIERDIEYLDSDECIRETLSVNIYEFTEDGKIA